MNKFDDIHPRDLRYCLTVLEEGNLTRASGLVGVSQTTLTYAVKRVELFLGYDLFKRDGRKLVPAEGSARFAEKAKALLADFERLKEVSSDEIKGVFKIGCHPVVGHYCLGPVIRAALQQFPEVSFELNTGLSRDIQLQVAKRSLDLGIVVNPNDQKELVVRELGNDLFTLWKATSLGYNKRSSKERILYLDKNLFQSHALLSHLQRKQFNFSRLIHVDNLQLAARLAEENAYALLPERVAAMYPKLRKAKLHQGSPIQNDRICLVIHEDLRARKTVRTLMRFLEKTLREHFQN